MDINRKEPDLALSPFVRNVQNNRGFTFVELLIAMVIVAILAIIGINGFTSFKGKARIARCSSEIRSLEKEIIAYVTEKTVYPATLDDIERGSLKDPWGNGYVYAPAGTRVFGGFDLNSDFDLYSKGEDGTTIPAAAPIPIVGNDDDIIRGGDGRFVGSAEMYGLL